MDGIREVMMIVLWLFFLQMVEITSWNVFGFFFETVSHGGRTEKAQALAVLIPLRRRCPCETEQPLLQNA